MSFIENDGKHIVAILDRTACDRHGVPVGIPCFHVRFESIRNKIAPAICNSRVKSAGYNGEISPSSLSRKAPDRPQGRSAPRRTNSK